MKIKSKKTFWLFLCSYISVLLIPMMILTAVWGPRMQQSVLEKSQTQHENALVQTAEQLDQQLKAVYSLPKRIFDHPRILSSTIMDSPITKNAARSDIEEMLDSNTFIEFVMLYLRDYDYFLSARTSSFYFSDLAKYPGTYRLTFGGMPLHEMYDLLETLDTEQAKYYQAVSLTGNTYYDMLLFFLPFPSAKQASSTCVVGIRDSAIDRAVKPITSNGAVCLLLGDEGQMMYCSDTQISECITANMHLYANASHDVQTQTLVLKGTEYSVTSITSQQTGWKYVSILPTSAMLADVRSMQRSMTLLLGMVLLLSSIAIFFAMRMNYTPIRRLTAFASSHAADGEHKSIDFDQIQELIVHLYSRNQALDQRLTSSNEQVRDMLLARILCGSMQEIQRALASSHVLHLEIGESQWQVLLAEYEDKASMENAEATAGAENDLFVIQLGVPRQFVCIRHGVENETVPERVLRSLGNPIRLVVSELASEPEGISTVYSAACSAMDYFYSSDLSEKILYCSSLQDRFYNPRFYPLDVMQALETAIVHGSVEQMGELMRQIEELLAVDGAPPYYIRSVYYNTISLLINGLRNANQDNETLITELTTRSVLPRYTVREMISILRNTAEKLADALQSKKEKKSIWTEELAYIDQNLSSPFFCLQEMADKTGMSASAFSRTFKETMGKNFKEYVDELRILRARDMLANTDLAIEQVANQVGYENVSSFYRFFKKYTGVAPGTYRSVSRNDDKSSHE